MNTAIIAQDTEVHESLRHLVFEHDGPYDVREPNVMLAVLPEGDPFWFDQNTPRRAKPVEKGESFYMIAAYDLATGARMFEDTRAPEGWWAEQVGSFDYQIFGRLHPNTYVKNGAYLFVSGGLWVGIRTPDEDGEQDYVSWQASRSTVREESAARIAAWLVAKAEAIAAVQPAWADAALTWADVVDGDEDDDVDLIEFRRNVGTVVIEQTFNIDDGVFTPSCDPEVRVAIDTNDAGVFSADDAARVGSDLIRATQILNGTGAISVEVIASVASALDVSPGDLYAVREFNAHRLDNLTLHEVVVLAREAGVTPAEFYKANA